MPNPNSKIASAFRVIRLADFSKGENKKSSEWNQGGGFLNRVRDFYLANDGSLIKRRGTLRANATSLGSGAIRGSIRFYNSNGDGFFLAYHGTTLYISSDHGVTFSSTRASLSSTARMFFTQWKNYVYTSNGSDAHQKIDVDSLLWTPWGLAAPTVALSGAAGAGGTPSGTYLFKYTWRLASGLETNGSPVSGSVVLAAQIGSLTSVAVGPTGTTSRRVYGFKNSVSTVYQLIGTISDNTTTTFSVTTDQSSWTTEIPTDHDAPAAANWFSVMHKNRIWMAGDQTPNVYFSNTLQAEQFPTTNFLPLALDHGDFPTAMIPLGDVLFVFGHESAHYIVGDDAFSFRPIRSHATSGCPGPWAVDRVQIPGSEAVLLYLSRNGLFAISGRDPSTLSEPEEVYFTDLPEAT